MVKSKYSFFYIKVDKASGSGAVDSDSIPSPVKSKIQRLKYAASPVDAQQ